MSPEAIALIIPAFIAGLLTFLAPCTLPLVPGYLGFISGVSAKDLSNPKKAAQAKQRVFYNGLLYVLGFSLVFILLGSVFAAAGSALAAHRIWLGRIGGAFVIFFGLYLMHVFDLSWFSFLSREHRWNIAQTLTPGRPLSSLLFGITFALGWTPCVGPVLGSILLLASTAGAIFEGAVLLTVFSAGLAVPFLFIALGFSHATQYIQRISKYLNILSFVGGAFLLFLGILLVTDTFSHWISYFYRLFSFLNAEVLIEYL